MIYRFGPFELDPTRFQLRRGSELLPLEPKVFDLLSTLARNHDRVVSKDELMRTLWPGEAVTPAVLPNNVAVLRKALGQARGQRQPVETVHGRGYRLATPVTVLGSPTRPVPATDLHVGRASALATAMAAAGRARDPSQPGQVVVICGASGMGKSRLVDELLRALPADVPVIRGVCDDMAAVPPLWPFTQLFRNAASEFPDQSADWSRSVMARLTGAASSPTTPISKAAAFEVCDVVAERIVQLARQRPCVLVVEDMQWADELSWQALVLLAERLTHSRLLVLLTLDEQALSRAHPGRGHWLRLARTRAFCRIPVEPLSRDDIALWLGSRFDVPAHPAVVDEVYRLSDGNPLLVEEILTESAGGDIEGFRDGSALPSMALPESALDRLIRPLAPLPPHLRSALEEAAVLGREFDFALLRRVSVLDPERLLDALDQAEGARYLVRHPAGATRYRFASLAFREAVYRGLSSGRRVAIHRAAASALGEQVHAADAEGLFQLARHHHRSLPVAPAELALESAQRAARAACDTGEFVRAAELIGWALDALDQMPPASPAQRCNLRLWRASCQRLVGDWQGAIVACEEVLAIARHCDLAEVFARAVIEMSAATRFPATVPARLLELALAMVPDSASPLRGVLLCRRIVSTPAPPNDDKLARWVDEVVALAAHRPEVAWAAQRARLAAAMRPTDLPALLALSGQMIEVQGPHWGRSEAAVERAASLSETPEPPISAVTDGPEDLVLASHRARIWALLTMGDPAGADQQFAAFERLARERRLPLLGWERALYRGARALADGRLRRASMEVERLEAWAQRYPSAATRHAVHAFRASLAIVEGTTLPFSESGLASYLAQYSEEQLFESVQSAWMAAMSGHDLLARRVLQKSIRSLAAGWPVNQHYLCMLTALGDVAVRLKDVPAAELIYSRLQPHQHLHATDVFMLQRGPVSHYMGRLAELLDEPQAARAHYQAAAERCRSIGAAPMLARVQAGLARVQGR